MRQDVQQYGRKKARKYAKRIANEKFSDHIKMVRDIVKPKPKWLPRKVWEWLLKWLIDFRIYENTKT